MGLELTDIDDPTNETSSAAYARTNAGALREQIYEYISAQPNGATCDEVERAMTVRHSTASARIRELTHDGRIHYQGTRATSSGCQARIYYVGGQPPVTVSVTITATAAKTGDLAQLMRQIRQALEGI
jgi:hypothetical protein